MVLSMINKKTLQENSTGSTEYEKAWIQDRDEGGMIGTKKRHQATGSGKSRIK